MKISVYCASSEGLDSQYYVLGEQFGRMLAQRGHSLVYGGYNKGIMCAVARGVVAAHGEIIAVVPKLFDRPEFTFEGCTQVIVTETMHARKAKMEEIGDAFAILPGGIGTFDEFFELYVLKSLGECDKPMGLLNALGCYDVLRAMLDKNTSDGLMSAQNRALANFYDTGEALLDALEREYNASCVNRHSDKEK